MAEVGLDIALRSAGRVPFLSGGYDDQADAEERYLKFRDQVDSAVFPGPSVFDIATDGHWLTVPSTHLPLTGAALYAALLRASLTIEAADLSGSASTRLYGRRRGGVRRVGPDHHQRVQHPVRGSGLVAGFAASIGRSRSSSTLRSR